jgi:hypothetical protein
MLKVYKYPVMTAGRVGMNPTTIDLPRGARVLSVGGQASEHNHPDSVDRVVMWALVDPDARPEPRRFVFCGTGTDDLGDLPAAALKPVGTAFLFAGRVVVHVFEVTEK